MSIATAIGDVVLYCLVLILIGKSSGALAKIAASLVGGSDPFGAHRGAGAAAVAGGAAAIAGGLGKKAASLASGGTAAVAKLAAKGAAKAVKSATGKGGGKGGGKPPAPKPTPKS